MLRRPLATLAALLLAPVVIVGSLSDRAPGAVERLMEKAQRTGSGLEDRLGLDIVDLGDTPIGLWSAGHLVLWCAVGAVAYAAVGDRLRASLIAVGLVVASFAAEIAQVLFTTHRAMQTSDMIANTFGVVLGVGGAAVVAYVAGGERRPA